MFNAAVQHRGAYLLVIACGRAELPELCAVADFAATVAEMRGCKRVLFDLLAVERGLLPQEEVELSTHLASVFGGFERVAAVRTQLHDHPGLPLRTFLTLEEAGAWVVQG